MRSARIACGAAALVAAFVMTTTIDLGAGAQKVTPEQLAARFTGTWVFNAGKSPDVKRPGNAGLMEFQPAPLRIAMAGFGLPQRGGRGGGGGGGALTEEQRAAQAAIRNLQGIPDSLTLTVTPASITIEDPRGSRTYAIDNTNTKIDVGSGAEITAKTRWDKENIRQEFLYGENRITHTWQTNSAGNELTFRMRAEDYSREMPSRGEIKVVYDKKP